MVFARHEDGSVRVVELPEPSDAEVENLVVQIARAVEKRVAKAQAAEVELADDQDSQKDAATRAETLAPRDPAENAPPISRRLPWAVLLKRVFAHDLLVCTNCGERRKAVAFLTERKPIPAILAHLGLSTEPPHVASARAPWRAEMFDDPGDPDLVYPDSP